MPILGLSGNQTQRKKPSGRDPLWRIWDCPSLVFRKPIFKCENDRILLMWQNLVIFLRIKYNLVLKLKYKNRFYYKIVPSYGMGFYILCCFFLSLIQKGKESRMAYPSHLLVQLIRHNTYSCRHCPYRLHEYRFQNVHLLVDFAFLLFPP